MSELIIKSIGGILNTSSLISPRFASIQALNLFTSPRKGRYTSEQIPFIESAFFEELEFDGDTVATYRWPGKNKTILLAHGWESNSERWSYLIPLLREQDYNIVALDAPAHGRSGSKRFNAILYSEFMAQVVKKHQPEIIIGHSVGGMATVFGMHNHNFKSLKKMILLGAPAHFVGVFGRYKKMMGFNERISSGLDQLVLENFGKTTDYFSASDFVSTFELRSLIIHDKKDKIIPFSDGESYAKNFKNSEFIATEGFGHSLKDASLAPKIIAFINQD
ncbi:alpha/beta hydrolase [Winogradskyella maritima]|uniref:Alpha/beta hydrolase n=1 Tax=Winogradskyella maritima TaxID=1517766 RepID=A0ABV8AK97_9FLAO|nr:alpha/beta hydrolase [Winogradskyella maritima]